MSYCNIFFTHYTREAVLDGFKKRHVYGATNNILADFRSGDNMMGDLSTNAAPELKVKLTGTAPFAKVKDNAYVYSTSPNKQTEFRWKDNSPKPEKTSMCAASSRTGTWCGCRRCGSPTTETLLLRKIMATDELR
jgi:hypothetical protein